jgi:hypothetical protein
VLNAFVSDRLNSDNDIQAKSPSAASPSLLFFPEYPYTYAQLFSGK